MNNYEGKDSIYHVFTSRMETSVDPAQMASQKPANLVQQCF